MAMTRSTFSVGTIGLLEEGLRKVFFDSLDLASLVYPSIYEINPSKKERETDHTVAGLPMAVKKDEGVATYYADFVDGYELQYTHSTYSMGVRLSQELMEDELYGVIGKRVKALGNSMRYRLEYDHASVFNNATGTTICAGADGLSLLNTAHTLAATPGTTVSNQASTDLTQSAIEAAVTAFRKMKNDRNLLVAIEPSTLLIPPDLEFEAYRLLNSIQEAGTADNDINAIRGRLSIVIWPFLTDTDAWFILSNKRYGAPISFKRVPVTFREDGDFDTDDAKAKARTRYSFGFTDWRWCYGSPGA